MCVRGCVRVYVYVCILWGTDGLCCRVAESRGWRYARAGIWGGVGELCVCVFAFVCVCVCVWVEGCARVCVYVCVHSTENSTPHPFRRNLLLLLSGRYQWRARHENALTCLDSHV